MLTISSLITKMLNKFKHKDNELKAIINSFTAFKKDPVYLNEAKEIDIKLNSSLPKDDKEWWKK